MDTNFQSGRPAPPVESARTAPAATEPEVSVRITFLHCLRWALLTAVPVMLKFSVLTVVTTDLSPIPMLWMVAEGLYWLSWLIVIAALFTMRPTALLTQRWLALLQAMAIVGGVFVLFNGVGGAVWLPLVVQVSIVLLFAILLLAALVCHAELVKDWPGTTHSWVLPLCALVGIAVGEVWSRYLLPLCFSSAAFDLVIPLVLACLLRPTLQLLALIRLKPIEASTHRLRSYALDAILPIALGALTIGTLWFAGLWQANAAAGAPAWQSATVIFGAALAVCVFLSFRPWRFALAIGIVLLLQAWQQPPADPILERSFFGVLRVHDGDEPKDGQKDPRKFRELMHGNVVHGLQFKDQDGKPAKDHARLATTYYHREGPVGKVMEKYNWFPENAKPQAADVRMPASLVGLGAMNIGALPAGQLVGLWSEPPLAVIGLGTGTMASYGRPYQHAHFYEIDAVIIKFSLPEGTNEPPFTFLRDAQQRGATIKVVSGDARLQMAMPYQADAKKVGGPDAFYQIIVVDAFSSDAVPVHLITKEAMQMYFSKLTEKGLLCVHVTNASFDLASVVASTAKSLDLAFVHGKDRLPAADKERTPSEWVIVARKAAYLQHLSEPEGYKDKLREHFKRSGRADEPQTPFWDSTIADPQPPWTDDYANVLRALRSDKEKPR